MKGSCFLTGYNNAKESEIAQLSERMVLSSIFDDVSLMDTISVMLKADQFEDSRHALIYDYMAQAHIAGEKFDAVTIANKLLHNGKIDQAGGMAYLTQLIDSEEVYRVIDPLKHALLVEDNARRNQLRNFSYDVHEKTLPGSGHDVDSLLGHAMSQLHNLSESSNKGESFKLHSILNDAMERMKERALVPEGVAMGVPSGFIDLDMMTNGFRAGQMIIIGARPAMGKTTFALDILRNAAVLGNKSTLFVSLEMSKEEISDKLICAQSYVKLKAFSDGRLNNDELNNLEKGLEELSKAKITISDDAKLDMAMLRTKCLNQQASEEGLDLVVIDYLQLMDMAKVSGSDGRQQAVSETSRNLKLLAKELAIPIIVLSQLSRAVESRPNKRPMPSDLRESGSLEQDADILLFLHRPEYYDPDDSPGVTELVLGKHRGGDVGIIKLLALLEYSMFANAQGEFPNIDNLPDDNMENSSVNNLTPEQLEQNIPTTGIEYEGQHVNHSTGELIQSIPPKNDYPMVEDSFEGFGTLVRVENREVIEPTESIEDNIKEEEPVDTEGW